jgi:DNA-binding CsgD family transcriptional regulator
MDAIKSDPDFASEADAILRNHGQALPLLTSASNAEFVFFTHDLERRLVFMSESSASVLGIQPDNWMSRKLDVWTDHPWNEAFKKPDHVLNPNVVQTLQAEIRNDMGEPVRVQVWRRLVTLREVPIGVVGMALRLSNSDTAESDSSVLDVEAIRKRIATLTHRERQVVELVVRGEMNRAIATKLNIAIRTVEARRSKAMGKMGAKRLTELVRMWIAAGESVSQ